MALRKFVGIVDSAHRVVDQHRSLTVRDDRQLVTDQPRLNLRKCEAQTWWVNATPQDAQCRAVTESSDRPFT